MPAGSDVSRGARAAAGRVTGAREAARTSCAERGERERLAGKRHQRLRGDPHGRLAAARASSARCAVGAVSERR